MSSTSKTHPESGSHESLSAERFTLLLPELIAHVARETTHADAVSRIARDVVSRLGASNARVYLMSPGDRVLNLVASENVDPDARLRTLVVNVDGDFPASVAARLGLLQLVDAEDIATFGRAPSVGAVTLAIPLFAGYETIGAIVAGFEQLLPRDCVGLGLLSHVLGALLDRLRLRDDVDRLTALAHSREASTALVVHDLRQPLNGILVAAGSLDARGSEIEQRVLERLQVCGLRLSRMISDLGDKALLESGQFRLHRSPTDLVALVTAVVEEHLPTASISIRDEVPKLALDAERVAQVLANLLLNAEKHGGAESEAAVDVGCVEGRVVISVTNRGGGIAHDERARVFDAHYRGRNRKNGAGGLGLGLYICRKLIEEHGGHIWTDGEAPLTRFSFSLPVVAATSNGAVRQVAREEWASG